MKRLIGSLALFVATLPACVMEEEATSAVAAAAIKVGDEIHASQLSLYNGWPIAGLSANLGDPSQLFHYSLEMGQWAGDELAFEVIGNSGDADLYVRKWSAPSTELYDCASFNDQTSNERCTFTSDMDGTSYYAILDAFGPYSNATIVAHYTHLLGAGSPIVWGGSNLSRSSFRIAVPPGKAQLRVRVTPLSGTNHPNLYLRFAKLPLVPHSLGGGNFPAAYDCKGTVSGNVTTCAISSPPGGIWYVMLEGVSSYNVTLEAAFVTRG